MAQTPPHGHGRVTHFRDTWRNLQRITTIRVIVQTIFFTLFVAFVLLTTFSHLDRFPALRHWVSKLLEIDPLVSISTAITTHTLYRGLAWSLLLLLPTLFLGRFFCDWICPYGSLHHFTGWVFNRRKAKQRIESNSYRRMYAVKYCILAGMLVAAIFGVLQIGLLDPICLLYRSFTGAVLPAANLPFEGVMGDYRLHAGAWLIGLVLFGLVAMNLVIPRFFCRTLCPLGALLGVLSRWSWWRIHRDPEKCNGCNRCRLACEGACDPQGRLRKSECFVCFNCIEECPEGALSFRLMPPKSGEVAAPDVGRRGVLFAGVTGLLSFPFVRFSGRSTRDFSARVIRPPGATEELEFLERCIKCDQCIRVCPTNVLQPATFEAGLEGLWTPVLNFRMGHCQLNCTACGQVCPTGAIQRLTVDRKQGRGAFAEQGPIRLGTAHFDTGRCLPYSKNIPCVVCEEVCPTSPKAIYAERRMRPLRDGTKVAVAATENTATLTERPEPGRTVGRPARFDIHQYRGDNTVRYFASVRHADGVVETHRIADNDADTILIEGRFARPPEPGTPVTLEIELKLPRVDTDRCIGCGLCERECPVVGDRRAVYVTAEGETRSAEYPQRDRNRSVRLL